MAVAGKSWNDLTKAVRQILEVVDVEGGGLEAAAHKIGGDKHIADTLSNINSKISDATLDDASQPRTPTNHTHNTSDIESGVFADARISESSVTQHEAAIDHNALANYDITEHRKIDDDTVATNSLYSSEKINTLFGEAVSNLDLKDPVVTVADSNITLSGEQTLNGVLTSNSRVGVVGQTDASENGIYVTSSGGWSRASDADSDAEVTSGLTFFVSGDSSDAYGNQYILTSSDPLTLGSSDLVFVEVPRIELGANAGQAAEGNDPRIPSQDENDALLGTNGTPSDSNRYVTNSDPRLSSVSEFFLGTDYSGTTGNYRVRKIGSTGAHQFSFSIPDDFGSLVELKLVGICSNGAAGSGKDIDLTSSYGAIGQSSTTHGTSDTGSTYDFTGQSNTFISIDISSLFGSIAAGDYCGLFVDHKGIGGSIDYLGIKMRYTKS